MRLASPAGTKSHSSMSQIRARTGTPNGYLKDAPRVAIRGELIDDEQRGVRHVRERGNHFAQPIADRLRPVDDQRDRVGARRRRAWLGAWRSRAPYGSCTNYRNRARSAAKSSGLGRPSVAPVEPIDGQKLVGFFATATKRRAWDVRLWLTSGDGALSVGQPGGNRRDCPVARRVRSLLPLRQLFRQLRQDLRLVGGCRDPADVVLHLGLRGVPRRRVER